MRGSDQLMNLIIVSLYEEAAGCESPACHLQKVKQQSVGDKIMFAAPSLHMHKHTVDF
jgi:hypothetical protein